MEVSYSLRTVSALLAVFLILVCSQARARQPYCNQDVLYNLPDFSEDKFLQNCHTGDKARVKIQQAKKFCDKDKPIRVVSYHEREDNVVYECHYLEVLKAARSQYFRWRDNAGGMQYTNTPPPADCTTADCRRIHEHWARETSLEDVLSSTLKDYKNTQARTRNAQHVAIRSQHPTILDYLQTTESSFLCIELSLAEKNETDFISSMRDLYHLDGPQLVYRAIMLELAGRFQVSQGSLERLLRQPASIWKGMPESLLNCSRPEPDLIYDTTDVFGIKKKQYVYEIKPDFEYVDIYDGKITRIQKVPIAHSPLTTDD